MEWNFSFAFFILSIWDFVFMGVLGDKLGTINQPTTLNENLKIWAAYSDNTIAKKIDTCSKKDKEQRFGCIDDRKREIQMLVNSLERILNFSEIHHRQMFIFDFATGLFAIEGALEKVLRNCTETMGFISELKLRSMLQRTIQMKENISNKSIEREVRPHRKLEMQLVGNTKKIWSDQPQPWKSLNMSEYTFESIGDDDETIWGALNSECLLHLLAECDVPYICERMFLDPTPQSQYMLTHQVLYVQFAILNNCHLEEPKAFKNWQPYLDKLCAKSYKEAEWVEKHNFPMWTRDVFAEYVGLCGLAGYTNFFRRDWIERILSWQSKSDSGCFLNQFGKSNIFSADKCLVQYYYDYKPTEVGTKKSKKSEEIEEYCQPHFTAVSAQAISVYFSYLMELEMKSPLE